MVNTEDKADKKVIAQLPARVSIEGFMKFEISLQNEFVRLAFQSTGGGVEIGPKIFVFDHRKETVDFVRNNSSDLDCQQMHEFLKVLNTSAKVVVMRKHSKNIETEYINLFSLSSKEKCIGLLSVTNYIDKCNAGFSVEENGALYSWQSDSSSRTGRHKEMIFLALTDSGHRAAIHKSGYANVGHDEPKIVYLGECYKEIPEAEYALYDKY